MNNLHYKQLQIWQKGRVLARCVFEMTKLFPREEKYSLTDQIRRAAVSVPSNIAEGSARSSKKEFAHFLLIAKGSLAELDTQLILASDFGYVTEAERRSIAEKILELQKMLRSFLEKMPANL